MSIVTSETIKAYVILMAIYHEMNNCNDNKCYPLILYSEETIHTDHFTIDWKTFNSVHEIPPDIELVKFLDLPGVFSASNFVLRLAKLIDGDEINPIPKGKGMK